MTIRFLSIAFFACIAQTAVSQTPSTRMTAPNEVQLVNETAEVDYFAQQVQLLKEAYDAKNSSALIVRESAVVMALRNEINQLEIKVAEESAQRERRKNAGSGQINHAAGTAEAPTRDPFAEAVTPDEKRLETFQYTLAAFERHSFDPAKPEEAARDFAKLDLVLNLMRQALDALKATQKQ